MNPNPPRLLRVEAVADLPVLWATWQRLDLPATLDRQFPAPASLQRPAAPRRGPGRLAPVPRRPGRSLPQPRRTLGRRAPGPPLRPAGQDRLARPPPRGPPRRLAQP